MKKIPLTQGQFALVDDEDFEYLNQWKWLALKSKNTWYAQRRVRINEIGTGCIQMHKLILNLSQTSKIRVDHKDHNGLNNQKYNLRIATASQNAQNKQAFKSPDKNTSQYKGVSFTLGKFKAEIMLNGQRYYLGRYFTEIEAAKAYDHKAKELFGEFACLNFPDAEVSKCI